MSILSKKQQIFGYIAADRTITEGMPKLKLNASFPSINNGGDVVSFLTDLIKALEGYQELVDTVIKTLTKYLGKIEIEIKNALQLELKAIVSCGVNPSLPDYVKSTGTGIKFTVDKIDFSNLMKIDPSSEAGQLIYTDIAPNLLDSKDFNTFLYQVIQNNGSTHGWGLKTSIGRNILTFRFKDIDIAGVDPNNTLTIKADPYYDNKPLSDLNNDFINSLTLFDSANLLIKIVDDIFGTVSNLAKKSKNVLENDLKVNHIIDKISVSNAKDILSDEFFKFKNEQIKDIEKSADLLKQGKAIYKTSGDFYAQVSKTSLTDIKGTIQNSQSTTQKKEAITNSINKITDQIGAASRDANSLIDKKNGELNRLKEKPSNYKKQATQFINDKKNDITLKLNFIQQIINRFVKALVNVLLSPKVLTIFLVNFKIIYGPNESFSGPIDFLKKNRNLVRNIVKRVGGIIIGILLKKALKRIAQLVAKSKLQKQIDKNKSNLTQLLSLVGVPQEVLRQIKGLL
jgi:hypothetical protein